MCGGTCAVISIIGPRFPIPFAGNPFVQHSRLDISVFASRVIRFEGSNSGSNISSSSISSSSSAAAVDAVYIYLTLRRNEYMNSNFRMRV